MGNDDKKKNTRRTKPTHTRTARTQSKPFFLLRLRTNNYKCELRRYRCSLCPTFSFEQFSVVVVAVSTFGFLFFLLPLLLLLVCDNGVCVCETKTLCWCMRAFDFFLRVTTNEFSVCFALEVCEFELLIFLNSSSKLLSYQLL